MRSSLDRANRAALSDLLVEARQKTGPPAWSQEQASEAATRALRTAADDASIEATRGERELWRTIEVNRHHVAKLENCPSAPLSTPERRARLLGLVLAYKLDRGKVNRIAGGL